MTVSQAATPAFAFRDGVLHAEEIPLPRLHRAVGPCYVYSRAALDRRVDAVLRSFGERAQLIAYAVKANTNGHLLRHFQERGLGAEVVSATEIRAAMRAGFPGSRLVCNGNGKSLEDLRAAIGAGAAWINLDGAWELPRLEAEAASAGHTFHVLLRVNPDLDAATHPYISTGLRSSKFGMDFDEARRVVESAHCFPHLRLEGLHVHLGSQIHEPGPIREGFARVRDFGLSLEGPGFRFAAFNLGGGFGVDYHGGSADLDLESLAEGLEDPSFWKGRAWILEPGRYLVADCGILLGEVLGEKRSHGRRFVICDLGMNDLIRPALYEAWHTIDLVTPRGGEGSPADVVGPICESADFLAQERALGPVEAGDLLAVRHAGAYAAAMASNYNGRLRLPEVWVEGDRAFITRRREVPADLERLEGFEEVAW